MARRLPSSLSICLRSCQLYRAGQTCYDCPNRGQTSCPIPDIEDLFAVQKTKQAESKALKSVRVSCRFTNEVVAAESPPFSQKLISRGSSVDTSAIVCTSVNLNALPVRSVERVALGTASAFKPQNNSRTIRQSFQEHNKNFKTAPIASNFFGSLGMVRSLAGMSLSPSRSFSFSAVSMPAKTVDVTAQIFHTPLESGNLGFAALAQLRDASKKSNLSAGSSSSLADNALVPMSSVQGRTLFTEALAANGLESYFPLSEQYLTQTDPTLSAVSSLAMVLNAINHDPQRTWKGPWRWNSEEVVQCKGACGHSLDTLRKGGGVELSELAAMARCKGVRAHPVHAASPDNAGPGGLARFRRDISDICSDPSAWRVAIVRFSRSALGLPPPSEDASAAASAEGHFSPLGGYHAARDMVLVLDVSRHRSPPFWVPLADLWSAMQAGAAGEASRGGGYVVISSLSAAPPGAGISPAWVGAPPMCPLMIRSWSEHVAGGHCCKGGERTTRRGAGARRRAARRTAPASAKGGAAPRREGGPFAELLAAAGGQRPLHTSRPQCVA